MIIKYEPKTVAAQYNEPYARILNRQRLKGEISEAIFELLDESGISKADFAKLLGTSKSHVTQMLSGSRNFTLDSLADIFLSLGRSAHILLGTNHEQPLPTTDEWKNSRNWKTFDLKVTSAPKPTRIPFPSKAMSDWNVLASSAPGKVG